MTDKTNDKKQPNSHQTDELTKVKQEFDELKQKFDAMDSQLKRALADYQNLEKRVAEGRSELTSWVGTSIIIKILPVMDHLDQAINGAEESGAGGGWLQGVKMAVKELRKVLEEEGLKPVQTEGFDPALHEAVDTKEGEDGKILEVVQMGYTLNDKVVKPAKVVVGKKG